MVTVNTTDSPIFLEYLKITNQNHLNYSFAGFCKFVSKNRNKIERMQNIANILNHNRVDKSDEIANLLAEYDRIFTSLTN